MTALEEGWRGRALVRWSSLWVIAAVGARTLIAGLLDLCLMPTEHYSRSAPTYLVLPWNLAYVATGIGMLALALFGMRRGKAPERRGTRWSAAALAMVLLAGLLAGKVQWHESREFSYEVVPPRAWGRFPHEGGRQWQVTRGTYTGNATAAPDGLRSCGYSGTPPENAFRVALVGDSFVFGLAIHDHDTLCAKLREQVPGTAEHPFVFLNFGQPGANAVAYADTLTYAVDVFKADLVLVGLLLPDDGIYFDLNATGRTFQHPARKAVGAFLHPHTVWSAEQVFSRYARSEGMHTAVIRTGVRAVVAAADATSVPTLVYAYDTPSLSHARDGMFAEIEALAVSLDERSSTVRWLGVKTHPASEGEWHIPGDGHPTERYNTWLASDLAPAILAMVP